jgi:hypothetical protein
VKEAVGGVDEIVAGWREKKRRTRPQLNAAVKRARPTDYRAPKRGRSMISALAVVKGMIAFAARSSISSAT